MSERASIFVGIAMIAALAIVAVASRTRDEDHSSPPIPLVWPASSMPTLSMQPAHDVSSALADAGDDAVLRYLAMRDDINAKPRLQLIDAWARQAVRSVSSDLLSYALVDPDQSVRERAQVLFDRTLSSH